jgi:hypothetical protein
LELDGVQPAREYGVGQEPRKIASPGEDSPMMGGGFGLEGLPVLIYLIEGISALVIVVLLTISTIRLLNTTWLDPDWRNRHECPVARSLPPSTAEPRKPEDGITSERKV